MPDQKYRADGSTNLVLKVKLYDWSNVKPKATTSQTDPPTDPATDSEKTTVKSDPIIRSVYIVGQNTNTPQVLIRAKIYRSLAAATNQGITVTSFDKFEENKTFQNNPEKYGFQLLGQPSILTSSGKPAEIFIGDSTNGFEVHCTPVVNGGIVDLNIKYTEVNKHVAKVYDIPGSAKNAGVLVVRIPGIDGLTNNLMATFEVQIISNTPSARSAGHAGTGESSNQRAVTFVLNNPKPEAEVKKLLLDAGVKIPPTIFFYNENGVFLVRGSPEQLALVDRVVLQQNGFPTNHAEENFIKNLQRNSNDNQTTNASALLQRSFKLDPSTFSNFFQKQDSSESNNPTELIRDFASRLGVDLESPQGKSFFYNERLGYLFVKATASDLGVIERGLLVISQVRPQLHIKARFISVPKNTLEGFENFFHPINSGNGQFIGILTSSNTQAILHALQSRNGVETLGEPEITVVSGRKVQMRATSVATIFTGMNFKDAHTNQDGTIIASASAISPQTNTVEFGPIFDMLPQVLSDGYTIHLPAKALLTEFFGYAQVPKDMVIRYFIPDRTLESNGYASGGQMLLANTWPAVQTRSQSANVNLYDGQTLVLPLNQTQAKQIHFSADERREAAVAQQIQDVRKKNGEGEVIVLVTATLVDTKGARIHSDNEMPFAQNGIPPQPAPTNADDVNFSVPAKPPSAKTNSLEAQTVEQQLIQDGKALFYEGKQDEAETKLSQAAALDPTNTTVSYYLRMIKEEKADRSALQRFTTSPTNTFVTGAGRQAIVAKLDKIHLDNVSWDNLTLNEVLKQLYKEITLRDPEHQGVNFLVYSGPGANSRSPSVDPITGQPVPLTATETQNVGSYLIKMPSLKNVRVADVLDAIVLASDHPLKYSVQDFAVVFSAKEQKLPQLFTRTFRIDANTFYSSLKNLNDQNPAAFLGGITNPFPDINNVSFSNKPPTVSALAREFFTSLGVNFMNPVGKSVFYNERLGYLFVKATESDLDTIQQALKAMNQTPLQVHIKARFYEMPKGSLDDFGKYLNATNPTNGTPMGIFSSKTAKAAIKEVQLKKDFEALAEPEFTVLSGRQSQVRATEIVTNARSGPLLSQTNNVEIGTHLGRCPLCFGRRLHH